MTPPAGRHDQEETPPTAPLATNACTTPVRRAPTVTTSQPQTRVSGVGHRTGGQLSICLLAILLARRHPWSLPQRCDQRKQSCRRGDLNKRPGWFLECHPAEPSGRKCLLAGTSRNWAPLPSARLRHVPRTDACNLLAERHTPTSPASATLRSRRVGWNTRLPTVVENPVLR